MTGRTSLSRAARLEGAYAGAREWLPSVVEGLVRFAASFVLAMANLAGGYSPLAVGFVAAAPPGGMSLAALLGAIAGHFLFGTLETSLKYSAMCVLTAAAVFAFRGTNLFGRSGFRALAAGVMAACTGFVYIYDAGWTLRAIAVFACETAAIAVSAVVYQAALSPWRTGFDRAAEARGRASVLLSAAALLAGLVSIRLFGTLSVGRAVASLCVLTLAFSGGITGGAVGGAVMGAMMDAASGTLFFTASFTLGGIAAALPRQRGRLPAALAYICCETLAALFLWELLRDSAAFYETFAASVLFMLLPVPVTARIGRLFPSPVSGYGAMLSRECAGRRASDAAAIFRELAEAVRVRPSDSINDENESVVFDRAAERVCRKCKRSADCWQSGYQATVDVFNNLLPKLRAEGAASFRDFPEHFAEKCDKLPRLADAINDELRARTVRLQFKSRALESRGAAAGQYTDTAAILDSLASELGGGVIFEPELERKLVKYLRSVDIEASAAVFRCRGGRLRAELTGPELRALPRDGAYLDKLSAVAGVRLCTTEEGVEDGKLTLFEAEPLSVTVGMASRRRKGESRCGDRASYFKTDGGALCVLLSDGAGTGVEAARCSASASAILERLLRAGTPPETALHLLNDLMLLKSDEAAGGATMDLLRVDLFSGAADVFKFGAAPSYAVSGKSVRRLAQTELAAPLGAFSDALPERLRAKLTPGSVMLLASDGVTRGLDDGWLAELLAGAVGKSAKELARLVVDAASDKFGADDDMTAIAVSLSERK